MGQNLFNGSRKFTSESSLPNNNLSDPPQPPPDHGKVGEASNQFYTRLNNGDMESPMKLGFWNIPGRGEEIPIAKGVGIIPIHKPIKGNSRDPQKWDPHSHTTPMPLP